MRTCVVAAAFAVLCCSAPVWAAELDQAPVQRLRVHGDIAEHCAISSPRSVDFGDLEREGLQADLNFGLDCNVPFVMQVQAEKGALTNLAMPGGQGSYSGQLPYNIALAIPTRTPSTAVIRRSFGSRELLGGQSISSQNGIATDGMDMRITLGHPDGGAGLLAGDYADTITITISSI